MQHPSNQAPSKIEWEQLHHEPFQMLVGLLTVGGAMLVLLEKPIARFFVQPILHSKEGPVLGLLLVLGMMVAIGLSRVQLRLGQAALLGVVSALVVLTFSWQPARGAAALWLLPMLLAVFWFDPKVSLLVGVASSALLLWGNLPAGTTALERSVVVLLLGALWIINQLTHHVRLTVWQSYAAYYQQAWQLLEAARDDRQTLNQANANLAHAYLQLERLTALLRASKVEAELARHAKEAFVANVSHELRTPLNMIIGFSEMMMLAPATYGPALPQALLADIGVIHRNSLHLSQLINDVLILSQIEANQMRLSRTWVDVGELVGEAVQAVEPLYKAKNLALVTTLPAPLPPLFCDRLRIRQVLLNLLSNAGRYTKQGSVQLEVTPDPPYYRFAVRDTGPGIAPEDQRRIFDPFQQSGVTTAPATESGGLGLTISRQLVELHQGRMWLESAIGIGSTFCFTLPATLPDPATAHPAPITRWLNPYSVYSEGERRTLPPLPAATDRILVLEATAELAPQLEPFLEEVEVIPVADVDALQAASRATAPALVLVNHAAAMSDQGFGRQLAGLPQRTPIISCYLPGKAEACQQLNVIDYLIKPVTRERLIALVTHAVAPNSTILLVEDEATLARLLRRQLSTTAQRYRILQAADGNTALQLMRSRQPDLVLLDLGLPDRDGYDILQEKNGDPQIAAIPVVIISARDPVGGPVLANRLRVELVGGLSVRDIATCVAALSQALSPLPRLKPSKSLKTSPD